MIIKNILQAFIFLSLSHASVSKKIVDYDSNNLVIQVNIDAITEADLAPLNILIGLPSKTRPIINLEKTILSDIPFTSRHLISNGLEESPIQKLQGVYVLPLNISPLKDNNKYYKKILIEIQFENINNENLLADKNQNEFLKNRIINWIQAKKWITNNKNNSKRSQMNLSGTWLKFFIDKDGMYSIGKNELDNIDPNLSLKNPKSYSLFMSSELGRPRTNDVNQEIPPNFKEVNILFIGESDGIFNNNDKIIFYGRGPSGFNAINNELIWNQNIYYNLSNCWLFIPDDESLRGKRVKNSVQPESGTIIDYGLNKIHLETDILNLEASGTEWVSNSINSGNSQTIILNLPSPKIGGTLNFNSRFRGASASSGIAFHSISLHFGNENNTIIGNTINWSGNAARILSSSSNDLPLVDGINFFYLKNSSGDNNSTPFLDYTEIQYDRKLIVNENFSFKSPIKNQNTRFSFTGVYDSNFLLWDITNPENAQNLVIENNGFCSVNTSSDTVSHFISFNINDIDNITELQIIEDENFSRLRNTNLSADYIIIGPEEFRNLTDDLINLRNPAIYASLEDIYNEFSAGNKDPISIRTFIQWTQEMWETPRANCLLLLGDGGYDYRNITGQSSIVVPTVQVQSYRSYATDDLLVTIYGNLPEIATGRFPAKNSNEVINFVNKILDIENNSILGPWRQKVTLIADDAARPEPNHGSISTGKSHTLNSEQLAELIPSKIYTEKLYMTEFPEVGDASAYGVVKPDATQALINSINYGTALISYIGHGSPTQLAQEKLLALERGDINKINNAGKLPVWIVGTCSFGHFDDPLTESFAEELIRSPSNAASAVISTTRPISVIGNERYTYDLFDNIFQNGQISDAKIGFILQSIKDGSNESQYFHLFGDPALKIPMPKNSIINLSINPDTLLTLEIGSFIGSQELISENGEGFIILYDAEKQVTREYQIMSETYSLSYSLSGPTLFRGKFSVDGETFSGQVRIPKDISYSNNSSKMIIYINDNSNELLGSIDNIILKGGLESNDISGPIISFETIEGQRLESGDHLSYNDPLIIRISDPIGINLTDELGHEILITNQVNNIVSNYTNQFIYDQNSITTGTFPYATSDARIELIVKAWDSANNQSNKEVVIFTQSNETLKLNNVYNFPNPFSKSTDFTFEINNSANVKIDIFTIGGRKIKTISLPNTSSGYHNISWDGFDQFGGNIAKGVYIYKLKATNQNSSSSHIGRCAKY